MGHRCQPGDCPLHFLPGRDPFPSHPSSICRLFFRFFIFTYFRFLPALYTRTPASTLVSIHSLSRSPCLCLCSLMSLRVLFFWLLRLNSVSSLPLHVVSTPPNSSRPALSFLSLYPLSVVKAPSVEATPPSGPVPHCSPLRSPPRLSPNNLPAPLSLVCVFVPPCQLFGDLPLISSPFSLASRSPRPILG